MVRSTREYVYGINPAFEVVRAGRRKVYTAYLNAATPDNPRLRKLSAILEKRDIAVEWVGRQRLFELSRSKEHQGAVLKTQVYPYASLTDLMGRPRLVLLDNVEDPNNVGGILRSAEVFGFDGVLLPVKGVPDIYPSVTKVSAGATEHLDIVKETSANKYVKTASAFGYVVIALDAAGKMDVNELSGLDVEKLLLVIGGEDRAVGQLILNTADHVVGIHQRGRINSLNASVAAGIALFTLGRKPRASVRP